MGRIGHMKPLIEVFIVVILLTSARAYDLNDSLEYGLGHTAFSLKSINSSNSSPLYRTYNLEKSEVTMAGNKSWFAESSGIPFINQSVNINLKNRSNLSIRSETARFNISDKLIYHPKKLGIKLADMYPNSGGNNSTDGLSQNSTIIVVHPGESIQAAINAATSGDIIEINSGTYNESLHINKRLTIRGVDIGGGLPIIDANCIGNAIEISADQVILEKIVSTNSSTARGKTG